MAYFHINWTRYSIKKCQRHYCPTCNKRQFAVSFFQEWYGWDSTCIGCGDGWQDGEMKERPFERSWRKRRIEQAKQTYRNLKEPTNE